MRKRNKVWSLSSRSKSKELFHAAAATIPTSGDEEENENPRTENWFQPAAIRVVGRVRCVITTHTYTHRDAWRTELSTTQTWPSGARHPFRVSGHRCAVLFATDPHHRAYRRVGYFLCILFPFFSLSVSHREALPRWHIPHREPFSYSYVTDFEMRTKKEPLP